MAISSPLKQLLSLSELSYVVPQALEFARKENSMQENLIKNNINNNKQTPNKLSIADEFWDEEFAAALRLKETQENNPLQSTAALRARGLHDHRCPQARCRA